MSATPTGSRAPGSFSPMISSSVSARPLVRRVESSDSESSSAPSISFSKRGPNSTTTSSSNVPTPPRPLYANSNANSSSNSLQNFSRPNPTPLRTDVSRTELRNVSPLGVAASPRSSNGDFLRGHARKHSNTQGSFEAYLPTAANSNLGTMAHANTGLSASQIAAQAAMQHQTMHMRQRSQTVPSPHTMEGISSGLNSRKASARGPISPPLLSLTEASAPKDSALGGQFYHNGLLGGPNTSAAQTAANVVFTKSPGSSPGLPPAGYEQHMHPDKPIKTEKSKVKLFSRPGKIGISKDKNVSNALPSPSKKASYSLASLQRSNFSTNSLADSMSSAASLYSMANSSAATIRGIEQPEKEKDKEKHKHHFLSRQKHKLSSKDDYHLPLSSAASNSKPVDPAAPSSLYQFNLPPSPGPTTTSFSKSVSGLDLRHGGRALRERKKEEKSESLRENELSYQNSNEWPGPSSLGSAGQTGTLGSSYQNSADVQELARYGLNNMTADDAWPLLKAKLLIIFEGEDLRLPVEEFNRLVATHLQRSIQKRQPNIILEDLRDLLHTGFSSLDQTLRRVPDERLIPDLVAMWLFTFTSILPYMQAVFLPLDLEFSGNGPLLTSSQARDFWGVLPTSSSSSDEATTLPAAQVLEVRRIVLTAYRNTVILPRFETLKQIFSRLSLDSISLPVPSADILSTSPDSFGGGRPGTAMSLDPSTASYNSQTTTLLNGGGSSGDTTSGSRSRAISNVSYSSSNDPLSGLGITSSASQPNIPYPPRPFTPSSTHPFTTSSSTSSFPSALNHNTLRQTRSQTVEDSSKKLTETVGRMLQCMSVLASLGIGGADGDEDAQAKMEELTRGLKLNWLGRGRMGRDRRGLVGARVVRGGGGGAGVGGISSSAGVGGTGFGAPMGAGSEGVSVGG